MIIPDNWLSRIFIKKKALPFEFSITKSFKYLILLSLYPLHIMGVGTKYFFYGVGLIVMYLVKGIVYFFHYIGVGTKYFFYGIGWSIEKLFNIATNSYKRINHSSRNFVWNSRRKIKSGFPIIISLLKRWINWILIIFIAVTVFIITPINPLEKILYTITFIMLGLMTYLLRDELGFIGDSLNKLVSYINTKRGMFMLVPLVIFTVSELLLVNSVQNVILFYSFCCVVFLIFGTMSEDKKIRNYWAMLILPVVLRMINLSLPFPIINSKIQLFLTYGLITYSSFLMAKGLGIKMPYLKGAPWYQYIIAIVLGLSLGTLEYNILGFVPIITILSEFDYIYLVFTIFIIGFGEEIVYRGLVQTTQDDVIGRRGALFLSSVLFGIMHLIWRNPIEFLFTTFAGFVFGYQFYKTNSIIPPTIAHIMNNTTWLIVAPGWGI